MADISIRNLSKNYGNVQALKSIDLEIRSGEFVVFVGPSGSGKSTLLRTIGGLEDATTGSVTIAGRDVSDLASSEREMAMVFQNHALFPHMTVRENTQFPLKMTNASAPDMSRSVNAAAELLRISELLDREPSELSGGERQRVAVGRAIVEEPKVFLFDEPLSNLDAELRVKMCGQIAKLHRSLSNTMIYVTHDQTEALAMADRIVVLRDGEIVQTGTPHDLYYQPASQFVAGLIGSPQMNFLDCELVSHHEETSMIRTASSESARLPVGPCDISPGTKLVLGVRPEHVLLEEKGDDVIAIDVVIDIVEHLGPMCLVHCQHIDGSGFAFQAPESISVNVGDRKRVWVEGASTYLFSHRTGRLDTLRLAPRHDIEVISSGSSRTRGVCSYRHGEPDVRRDAAAGELNPHGVHHHGQFSSQRNFGTGTLDWLLARA